MGTNSAKYRRGKSQTCHTIIIVWPTHIYPSRSFAGFFLLIINVPRHSYPFLSFHFSIPVSLPFTLFHSLFCPCFPVRPIVWRSSSAILSLKARELCGPVTKCLFPLPNDSSTTGRSKGKKDQKGRGSGEGAPVSLLHWTVDLGKHVQSFLQKSIEAPSRVTHS